MDCFVVDTNVAVVANDRDTHVDISCCRSCVQKIRSMMRGGVIVLDEMGLIMNEYGNQLKFAGAPGVGDSFFKYLFDRQHGSSRVRRVAVTCSSDQQKGFLELPENKLDPSDRKFLAVAVVSGAVIVNATDSDWSEQQELMDSLGVKIEQLCPDYACKP